MLDPKMNIGHCDLYAFYWGAGFKKGEVVLSDREKLQCMSMALDSVYNKKNYNMILSCYKKGRATVLTDINF